MCVWLHNSISNYVPYASTQQEARLTSTPFCACTRFPPEPAANTRGLLGDQPAASSPAALGSSSSSGEARSVSSTRKLPSPPAASASCRCGMTIAGRQREWVEGEGEGPQNHPASFTKWQRPIRDLLVYGCFKCSVSSTASSLPDQLPVLAAATGRVACNSSKHGVEQVCVGWMERQHVLSISKYRAPAAAAR